MSAHTTVLAHPGRATARPPTRTTPRLRAVTGHPGQDAALDRLVGQAVAGVPRAQERLVAGIHPLIVRYCRGRLDRRDTVIRSAEDVAQDICRAVVVALPGYPPNGRSFSAFVYGIAAQTVTDALQDTYRRGGTVLRRRPGQRLLAADPAEQLREIVDLLNPADREVIVLRVLVGLSAEQTAQALRSTPGSVRLAQHHALNRLRDLISLHQPQPTAPDTAPAAGSVVVAVIPGQRRRYAHALAVVRHGDRGGRVGVSGSGGTELDVQPGGSPLN